MELEFSREDQTCMVTASRARVMANVTVGFHGCTWSSRGVAAAATTAPDWLLSGTDVTHTPDALECIHNANN